jgi:hypothetical protein
MNKKTNRLDMDKKVNEVKTKQANRPKKTPRTKAVRKKAAPRKPANPLLLKITRNEKIWNQMKVMEFISDHFATSSKGLGSIIIAGKAEYGDFPVRSTILKWLSSGRTAQQKDGYLLEEEQFAISVSDIYELGKEFQADFMADEIIEIADDDANDYVENLDKDGKCIGYKVDGEAIQRSRLRVDARKWVAAKLRPKKYGDKQQLQHSGADGKPLGNSLPEPRVEVYVKSDDPRSTQ